MKTKYPYIVAHRGASADAYENSFSAFELAIKQGADMIELDTHLTQDGFFIVHHDPIIEIEDKVYIIKETKLEKISELRLPNGEPIPLLEEVLQKYISSIKFNVEIKCDIKKQQFYDMLQSINIDYSRIMVSSFLVNVLDELKDKKYNFSLALLYLFPNRKVKQYSTMDYLDAINPYYRFLNKKIVNKFHDLNKNVVTWTVDKKSHIKKCVKLGIEGIITNKPKETRMVVEELLSKQ